MDAFLQSDWVNGKCALNGNNNTKVIENLKRIVEARKKMKVTMLTVKMAARFKSRLKSKLNKKAMMKKVVEKEGVAKEAWTEPIPLGKD